MESLLFFIVIIAISALSNWLKRKQEEQQKQGSLPPDAPGDAGAPAEAPQPRKPWDWEAELRRLFDDRPEPASSQPAEPPPVIRPPEPTPAAAPASRPAPPPSPRPSPVPAFKEEMNAAKQRLHERLAALKRADTAYSRAQRLDQNVSARLDQLGELRQELGRMELRARPARGPQSSRAVQRVRRALGRPQTAREVVIAAEILARPPGLQP